MLPRLQPASVASSQRPTSFDVSTVYALAMRLSLAMGLLPGLATGLLLVLIAGAGLRISLAWPQLAQAHGQVQALGFVLLFITAVGLQLFPRFLGAPLLHAERAGWGASMVAIALLLRLIAQPLADGPLRAVLLVGAAVAVPVGALVAGAAFHGLSRRSVQPSRGPSAAWRRFVAVAGLGLGFALVVYVWAGLGLAAGEALVAPSLDEALIHLELGGFATALVLAVASRVFGRFLLLQARAELERWLPPLAAVWGVGLALVGVGWLVEAVWAPGLRWLGSALELVVVVAWVWLIGLYRAPSRASGSPHITNPTRRWVQCSFGFLLGSLALYTFLFGREVLFGVPPLSYELSSARHALGQGFLLPLMATMAARLLPIYSADVLRHRTLLEVTIDLLLLGALLRVVAEALGGYQPVFGTFVAIGSSLTLIGYCVFAGRMWAALGRLP
jgi:hypothetical protein